MTPELESLLQAYDDFHQAEGREAKRLRARFDLRLEDVATRTGLTVPVLQEAIRRKYLRWRSATAKITTLPPKA